MMSRACVMVVFGTRPEAIKMAPVIAALRRNKKRFKPVVVVTGQHKEMLAQCLNRLDIQPEMDLSIMTAGQTLHDITCAVLKNLPEAFRRFRPHVVLVQGDTTTTFATALCAYYHAIPVGHVEAGLRTRDKFNPYPEEINRCLTGVLADLHFAPTQQAQNNLLLEGIPKNRVYLTGNTIVDILQEIARGANRDHPLLNQMEATRTVWLLTLHRRESFGKPMERILRSIKQLAAHYPDVEVIFPVHLNPRVRAIVYPILRGTKRIHLLDPVDYFSFIGLLSRANLVLTDSGGVQEEAPSLGKPVLVLREKTERPEGITAGAARLVGTDPQRIQQEVSRLMENPRAYKKMANAVNPYGDGHAAERIVRILEENFIKKRFSSMPQKEAL